MSGINETNKIVDLQQRQAIQSGAPDRVGELLKLVRATALKRINGLVTNLFENIDDGIPVLLADEAMGTTQLHDFPA